MGITIVTILLSSISLTVCTRHPTPIISDASMKDAVVLLGQDAEFICKVENLGKHKVAFVLADTPPRLISFDEKIFRKQNKYDLRPRGGPQGDEWSLVIRNAQEADRGNYTCQINTDPVTSVTAELDLRIPPSVSRSTPSAVEVREGHNVTLTCKAEGTPEPSVIWRRQDRQIIRFNGATGYGATIAKGASLQLTKVSRKHMSEYVCVASNGIPPDESWTVKLLVTFPPMVLAKHPVVRASPGSMARLICDAESWPRPEVTWEKDGRMLFDSDLYSTTQTVAGQYHSVHILEIRHVEPQHYGGYRCIAKNDNGIHHAEIILEESEPDFRYTNSVLPEGSGVNSDDEDSESADDGAPEDVTDTTSRGNHIERHRPHHSEYAEETSLDRNSRHPNHERSHGISAQQATELKQEPEMNAASSVLNGILTVFIVLYLH